MVFAYECSSNTLTKKIDKLISLSIFINDSCKLRILNPDLQYPPCGIICRGAF